MQLDTPILEPRSRALWRNLLIFLALNATVRLGLVLWNGDSSLLLPWRLLPAMAIGAVFDTVAALHLMAAGALLLALWPARRGRMLRLLPAVWMLLTVPVSAVLSFTALSEFTFWLEFASRFNFVAVDYLVYSQEVMGNIRQSYNLPLLLAVAASAALVLCALQWRLVARHLATPCGWSGRRRIAVAVAMGLLPVLSFPLVDSRYKEFSTDAQLNEIAGNGYYDFFHAFRHNELDYERLYRTMDAQALEAWLAQRYRQSPPRDTFHRDSWQRAVAPQHPSKRLNVVLVSMESMGASFMKAHGGSEGLTPELDALAEQGLHFTRVYATGTRTVRGLEALSLSVPPTPGHAIVTRPANGGLYTIGQVLGEAGYSTQYLYGGYATFDNMRAFFGGNGYTVVDRSAIASDRIHHETVWGVADEDLFDMALDQLDAQHASGKPFFAHIMTTSNHRPFTYPEGRIDIPSKNGRAGGVKYTDYAVGRFIKAARQKPWAQNTLFVIVADHTHNGRGKQELPPQAYHIPLIMLAPHLKPSTVDTLASQIDVAPTILSVLGLPYTSRFFGQDILTEGPHNPRALLANYQTVGLYRNGWVVELKPQRRVRVVKVDDNAAEIDEQRLIEEAIAHYQAASVGFKRGWLRAPGQMSMAGR